MQWEPLSNLKCKEPYVLKLIKNFDEKLKAFSSGVDTRPINETEVDPCNAPHETPTRHPHNSPS